MIVNKENWTPKNKTYLSAIKRTKKALKIEQIILNKKEIKLSNTFFDESFEEMMKQNSDFSEEMKVRALSKWRENAIWSERGKFQEENLMKINIFKKTFKTWVCD